MVCNKCIHNDVCEFKDCAFGNCKFFIDKSRFHVQTPCDIGDKLYYVFADNIFEATVSMLQKKKDKTWKVRISTKFGVTDFMEHEIGSSLFWTYEDALKKLEEVE